MEISIIAIKDISADKGLTPEKIEKFILENPDPKFGFVWTLQKVSHLNQMNGYDARHKLMLLSTCLKLLPTFYDMDRVLGVTNQYVTEAHVMENLMKNICKCVHSLNQSKKYSDKRYSFELITIVKDK